MKAALLGIVLTFVVSFFDKSTRLGPKDIIMALVDGARTALAVAAATACAGIIVGVVVKTGLGLSLANGLVSAAGGNILLTLIFTMLAALSIGDGFTDDSKLCHYVHNCCSSHHLIAYGW